MQLRHALFAAMCLAAMNCRAGPADYIFTPEIEQGEWEVEMNGGWADQAGGDLSAAGVGFGRGFTSRWSSELYVNFVRAQGAGTRLEGFEWENRIRLSSPDSRGLIFGLVTEFEMPRESDEPKEAVAGLMTQAAWREAQINFNVLLEREFGGSAEGEREVEMKYQWQARALSSRSVDWGVQGFGELGEWNDWDASERQEHIAGPALFVRLPLEQGEGIKLNAGWLFGLSAAAPDHTIRLQVEVEL